MRHLLLVFALLLAVSACSKSDDNNAPDASQIDDSGAPDASGTDVGRDAAAADADTPDQMTSFCATADCAAETPVCSELLGRCVECASNNDCTTAPEFTCETVGDGMGGDPLYECVECIDDSVCAGGTCDLTTHTCVP